MVPSTRRAFLHGAAGLAAALSGCGELTTGQGSRTRSATEAVDEEPSAGPDPNVDVTLFRTNGERPPIWLAESNDGGEGGGDSDGNGDDGDNGRPTPRADERFIEATVISTGEQAARVASDGVEETRVSSVLDDTDFETESVYLETIRVEECFRLVLCDIAWSAEKFSTDYSRQLRPYDERCGVDEWAYEVRLVRIPESFSADEPRGHSTSIGGDCRGGAVADGVPSETVTEGGAESGTETGGDDE